MRTVAEIEAEIVALVPIAKDYETDAQCFAAGAHDALRWALGLAETPISEYFGIERVITKACPFCGSPSDAARPGLDCPQSCWQRYQCLLLEDIVLVLKDIVLEAHGS